MSNLTIEQEALRTSIKESAIIWGCILGLVVAGLAYWLLGSQGLNLRISGAALVGVLTAGGIYRKNMSSGTADAKCTKCNAAFSVARVDRQEVMATSTPKEKRKNLDNGDTEITTWIEEVYDVKDTYECATCSEVTHKTYQSTRRKDEKTVVKSVRKKGAGKGNSHGKGKSSGKN